MENFVTIQDPIKIFLLDEELCGNAGPYQNFFEK